MQPNESPNEPPEKLRPHPSQECSHQEMQKILEVWEAIDRHIQLWNSSWTYRMQCRTKRLAKVILYLPDTIIRSVINFFR